VSQKIPVPQQAAGYIPAQKASPLVFAQLWLGTRLDERRMPDGSTSYYLDGRPARLDALMLEANRMAARRGQPMLTVNPRWVPR
jgi:hypothetical protein